MTWQSKYSQLAQLLAANGAMVIKMRLAEIDPLVPGGLPATAYRHRSWWTSNVGMTAQSRHGWVSAGYEVSQLDLTHGIVTFTRWRRWARLRRGTGASGQPRLEVKAVTLVHKTTENEGQLTVVLAGEACLPNLDQLYAVLFQAIHRRPREITVDLRGLISVDSMCISALVAARRAAMQHGVGFLAVNPQGTVREVFERTGLLSILSDSAERPGEEPEAG